MTNRDQLSKHFPEQMPRIETLVGPGWLDGDPEGQHPRDTLASAFIWNSTSEGWDYWNKLCEECR